MKKEERLQIRVESEQLEFLRTYASKKNITISKMVRDFIDWLMRRDKQQEDSSGTPGTPQS